MPSLSHLLNFVGTVIGFLSALILSVDTVGDVRARQVMRRIGGVWRLFDRADPETGIAASFALPVGLAGVAWLALLYGIPATREHPWLLLVYAVVLALVGTLLLGWLVTGVVKFILYIRRLTKSQHAGWIGFVLLMVAFLCQIAATFIEAFEPAASVAGVK